MTWTYNLAQLSASQLMQVRFVMGDTVATDPQIQDEEITLALSMRPSVYGAAAFACRSLAARLARQADTVDKDLRTQLSQRSRSYLAMANTFEQQDQKAQFPVPYAGGISIADKARQEQNADRVTPQFNLGMQDNTLPVGAAGNETQTQNSENGLGPGR